MYKLYLLEGIQEYKDFIEKSVNKSQAVVQLIKTNPENIYYILSTDVLSVVGKLTTKEEVADLIDYLKVFKNEENQEKFLNNIIAISDPQTVIEAIEYSVSLDQDTKKAFMIHIFEKYNIEIEKLSENVFSLVKNNAMFIKSAIPQIASGIKGSELRGERFIHIISKGLKNDMTRESLKKIFFENNANVDNVLYHYYDAGTNTVFFNQFYDILLMFNAERLYRFYKNSKSYKSSKYSHMLEDMLVNAANILERDQALQLIKVANQNGGESSLIDSPKSITSKIQNQERKFQVIDILTEAKLTNLTNLNKMYKKEDYDELHVLILEKDFKKMANEIVNTLRRVKERSSENSIIFILIDMLKTYKDNFKYMDRIRSMVYLAYQYNIMNNTVKFMFHMQSDPNLKVFLKDNFFAFEPENIM